MVQRFNVRVALAYLTSCTIISPAYADAYCAGMVNDALTYNNGDLMVYTAWRGDWTTICNVNVTRNNVSPQTCFTWYSTINSAILYGKNVGFYYSGMVDSACPTLATYDIAPTPVYVRLAR